MLVILPIIILVIFFGFRISTQKQTVLNNESQKIIPQNITEEIYTENYSSIKIVNEKGQPIIFQNDTLFFQILTLQHHD